jgi:ligand-binding sensor domain-containing protein
MANKISLAFRKSAASPLFFVVIVFVCSLCTRVASAQISPTGFRHIGSEQGLSNTTILCAFQDSRGFMWFGTRDGLNRYDGVNVTVYKNNPHSLRTIRDNFIRCIYEDGGQKLWIGTSYGLTSFNPQTDRFTRYWHSNTISKNPADDIVTSICGDAEKNLWICTFDSGIYKFDIKTHYFIHFSHNPKNGNSLSSDSVNYIFRDKQNRIWAGTQNGLNSLDTKTSTFKAWHSANKATDNITCITQDNAGNLWLGTATSGLVIFNPQTQTFKYLKHNDADAGSLSSDLVISLLADKKGNIWVGTQNGGLNLFNPHNNSFYKYTPLPGTENSLSNLTVSALVEDNQGDLWVGTNRGGVNLYTGNIDKFKMFRAGLADNTLSYDDVKAFFQDKEGNIWIGTDGGGLNLFDKKTNTFKRYKNEPLNPNSLSSNAVQAIAEDAKGNLWVGTWGGGLNLMDKKTGKFTRFRNDPGNKTSLSSDFLQRMYLDSQGNFWVATYYGGLDLLNQDTHQFTRITKDPSGSTSLTGNNVVSIGQDNDGNVWFGTDDGGLNKYNLGTKHFSHYFDHEDKKTDSRVLFTDSKGRFWVGLAGLYLFDKASNNFKLFTTKYGLDTLFIKGITEGDRHNLWISTSNGLVRLNPNTGESYLFNTADGLQGMEFEANSYLQANDGEMFFGGISGFNSFYPDNIVINKYVPPVYITSLQLFNKYVVPGTNNSPLGIDISYTKHLLLYYTQSSISFTFAALNYVNPVNNRYMYKLEGFDTTWIEAGPERKAVYTNLDPGKYIFRVKASNNDGVWNDKGAAINVVISPAFWLTWWFRILIALVILSIFYAYNRYTVNAARR